MSQFPSPNFDYSIAGNTPPRKKSNAIWIVLGIIGGCCLMVIAMCCGVGLWLSSFPSVPASATQPFEIANHPAPAFPKAEPSKSYPNIAERYEVTLGDGSGYGIPAGVNARIWIYKPKGNIKPKSIPCVLICGAGTTLMEGIQLTEGDEVEHLPYVQAGFIVVAYDLDGDNPLHDPQPRPYNAFRASCAGLINAHNAIEYALTQIPEVNPSQIFTAGHSSAGTLALLFAEHEPRLAGCVAYAPCIDTKARVPGFLIRTLSAALDGLPEFIVQSSPRTHEKLLNCPTMIFHAADDSNVPVQESRDFVARMQGLGKNVTFVEAATGDHYQSMIDEGIPKGVQWLKAHLK